ncbi:MAG: hypothetical protein M1817_002683 [Caeruleum heppii]|nr:MAG: hypothetical protein M1817_002683 [Caeruleum heppii]
MAQAQSGLQTEAFDPFRHLESAPALKDLFHRFPTLRSRLESIYAATLEPDPFGGLDGHAADANAAPRRQPYRGRARGRGQGGREVHSISRPWTVERGLEDGLDQLRRAKEREQGIEAEALQEFASLVIKAFEGRDPGEDGAQDDPVPRTAGESEA